MRSRAGKSILDVFQWDDFSNPCQLRAAYKFKLVTSSSGFLNIEKVVKTKGRKNLSHVSLTMIVADVNRPNWIAKWRWHE